MEALKTELNFAMCYVRGS